MDERSAPEFDALYRAHRARVRTLASARVAADEVDDVVAIAFATAWRRRADLPRTRPELERWLLWTTELAARNVRRARRRRRALDQHLGDQPEPPPSAEPDEPWLSPELERALERLAPEDRALIVATVLEGRPTAEVARSLGLTPDAARTRLSRARARLRAVVRRHR